MGMINPANVCAYRSPNKIFIAIGGWQVFASNVHAEAQEDDVRDLFEEFGKVTNVRMIKLRRSDVQRSYALVEFGARAEAESAISQGNGKHLSGKPVRVGWAYVGKSKSEAIEGRPPSKRPRRSGSGCLQ